MYTRSFQDVGFKNPELLAAEDRLSNAGEDVISRLMPARGDGENQAQQAVTAANRLGYRLLNDGDTISVHFANFQSDTVVGPAQWLYDNVPECWEPLVHATSAADSITYTNDIADVVEIVTSDEVISRLEKLPHTASDVYDEQDHTGRHPLINRDDLVDEDDLESYDDDYDDDDYDYAGLEDYDYDEEEATDEDEGPDL